MKFAIVLEKAESNYSVYVPDLPGCISVGDTIEEAKEMITEAIKLHLEGMKKDNEPLPEVTTLVDFIEV